VRRKANKLADLLANQGVICTDNRMAMDWQDLPQRRLKTECQNQVDEDKTVFHERTM